MVGRYIVIGILVFTALGVAAQVPDYRDFPSVRRYYGRPVEPIITKADRQFRTRVRFAAKRKPDFAGEFILAQFGCGAECLGVFALNARTGRVSWLPFSSCCWRPFDAEAVSYRLDSRLISVRGLRNEGSGNYAGDKATDLHFYELKDGEFRFVRTLRDKAEE